MRNFWLRELQEWQKLSEEQKYRYSEELAAHLPQSVIFKGLPFYPDGSPELSIAIFEYGEALFSLMPGGEVQIGCEADNFRPTDSKSNHFKIPLRSTGSMSISTLTYKASLHPLEK